MSDSIIKTLLGFSLVFALSTPTYATFTAPGSGLPTTRCAYNASPQRRYAPPAVAAAQEAIKKKKSEISRLKKKIKDIKKKDCIRKCKRPISKAIRLVDSRNVEDMYLEHLSCSDQFTNCYTQLDYYNKWAEAYDWQIYLRDTYNTPYRAIASAEAVRGKTHIDNKAACDAVGKHWYDKACYKCKKGYIANADGCRPPAAAKTVTTPPLPAKRPVREPTGEAEDKTCPDGKTMAPNGDCCNDKTEIINADGCRPKGAKTIPRPEKATCTYPNQMAGNGDCCTPDQIAGADGCRPKSDKTIPRPEKATCTYPNQTAGNGDCCTPDQTAGADGCSPKTAPEKVDPKDSKCQRPKSGKLDEFAVPDCGLKLDLCTQASTKRGFSSKDMKSCRYCLKPTSSRENGRYSHCLAKIADLEVKLAELEEELEELEDELEEAKDDAEDSGSEATVCVDCIKDNRSFFERYGPTLVHALLGAGSTYFAYDQYNQLWEDNNAKGFTSDPRGGYALASFGLGQGVGVLNTALSTGAFGCTQGNIFGQGNLAGHWANGLIPGQAGANVNAQIGGTLGTPLDLLLGLNGNVNASGGIFANAGGAGPWGTLGANNIFNIPNSVHLAGSVFGQGNVGINGAGGFNTGANSIALAQMRAQLQQAEAQYARQRDISAIVANANAQINAINTGFGVGTGINTTTGNNLIFNGGFSGRGTSVFNGGFNTNTQIPLRPTWNGDPNLTNSPALPNRNGLPQGITLPNTGGPASSIGL